jgi:hypothetical protein
MKWTATVMLSLLITVGLCEAQENVGKKTPPPAIILWINERSIKDGMALIRASHLDLALKHASCMVPLRTRAVLMTGGYDAFHVTITEGKHRGCRGYVMREMYEYLTIEGRPDPR